MEISFKDQFAVPFDERRKKSPSVERGSGASPRRKSGAKIRRLYELKKLFSDYFHENTEKHAFSARKEEKRPEKRDRKRKKRRNRRNEAAGRKTEKKRKGNEKKAERKRKREEDGDARGKTDGKRKEGLTNGDPLEKQRERGRK